MTRQATWHVIVREDGETSGLHKFTDTTAHELAAELAVMLDRMLENDSDVDLIITRD